MSKKVVSVIFAMLLPIFLLLLSYKIILFSTSMTDNQQNAIDFLDNKNELVGNYTQNERSHMQDVKVVMKYVDIVFYVLLLLITLTITYFKRSRGELASLFKHAGFTTTASVTILIVLSLLSFNSVFSVFHDIFFPQGNWQFPIGSFLIQTFPLDFFIMFSTKTFILTLILGIILYVLGTKYSLYNRN